MYLKKTVPEHPLSLVPTAVPEHLKSFALHVLDHVEDGSVLVEPHVVIRYCHGLESDFFGVFEK